MVLGLHAFDFGIKSRFPDTHQHAGEREVLLQPASFRSTVLHCGAGTLSQADAVQCSVHANMTNMTMSSMLSILTLTARTSTTVGVPWMEIGG